MSAINTALSRLPAYLLRIPEETFVSILTYVFGSPSPQHYDYICLDNDSSAVSPKPVSESDARVLLTSKKFWETGKPILEAACIPSIQIYSAGQPQCLGKDLDFVKLSTTFQSTKTIEIRVEHQKCYGRVNRSKASRILANISITVGQLLGKPDKLKCLEISIVQADLSDAVGVSDFYTGGFIPLVGHARRISYYDGPSKDLWTRRVANITWNAIPNLHMCCQKWSLYNPLPLGQLYSLIERCNPDVLLKDLWRPEAAMSKCFRRCKRRLAGALQRKAGRRELRRAVARRSQGQEDLRDVQALTEDLQDLTVREAQFTGLLERLKDPCITRPQMEEDLGIFLCLIYDMGVRFETGFSLKEWVGEDIFTQAFH